LVVGAVNDLLHGGGDGWYPVVMMVCGIKAAVVVKEYPVKEERR
jgi:hypothetical protein